MIAVPDSLRVEPGVWHRVTSHEVLDRSFVTGEPVPTMCGRFITTGNATLIDEAESLAGEKREVLPRCIACEDMIDYLIATASANSDSEVTV